MSGHEVVLVGLAGHVVQGILVAAVVSVYTYI